MTPEVMAGRDEDDDDNGGRPTGLETAGTTPSINLDWRGPGGEGLGEESCRGGDLTPCNTSLSPPFSTLA